MNFRKLIFAALVICAAASCKKDEEDTITPGLDGSLSIIGLPQFVGINEEVTVSVKGVTHPEGKELTYSWKVSPSAPTAVKGENYTITFSDTLQTCTVYCTASAEGYAGSSASAYVTVVKGGKDGSIKGIDFPDASFSTPIDDYSENTYFYWEIGSQTWMLNNAAERSSGKPYENCEVMSDVLGRYYSYDQAVAVCESLATASGQNWKLPSLDDWKTLEGFIKSNIAEDSSKGKSVAAALLADATFNSFTMWEYWPAVGTITNSSKFAVIPAGYANLVTSSFDGVYDFAAFWTGTEHEQDDNMAYAVNMAVGEPEIYYGTRDKKSFGASVRCILK